MDLQEELINSIGIILNKALSEYSGNTEIAIVVPEISSNSFSVQKSLI